MLKIKSFCFYIIRKHQYQQYYQQFLCHEFFIQILQLILSIQMDFSIRNIHNYYKLIKSRRSLINSPQVDKRSDSFGQNHTNEQFSNLAQTAILKPIHNHHLLNNIPVSYDYSKGVLKKPTIVSQKTEESNYEPFSKRKDSKKLKTLSYKNQKTQRSLKDQIARQDLKYLGQISIANLNKNPETSELFQVRINKNFEETSTESSFQKWRVDSPERHRNSKSPFKNRTTMGKRAKNSPKKKSMSVRIKRTFINNSKDPKRMINLSKVEYQVKGNEMIELIPRKSSITPWQIEEEGCY